MSTVPPPAAPRRDRPSRPSVIPIALDQTVTPAAVKGRGTAWSIASRYERVAREAFDDGWGGAGEPPAGDAPRPSTTVLEQDVGSIVTANDSPDIAFDLSVNPYRGCEHGCIYCFARPTHSYLELSPGIDFETRILAKRNAAERLRATLARPGYRPGLLNIGSATDAYQPAERRLGITRSVIEVLAACEHPFSVVTKSAGILRDLDLIAPMAARRLAAAYVSVTTLDPALARILEPRAASPARRLETIRRLSEAGVAVGLSVSPMIPFLNEPELERLLEAGAAAGARSAFMVVLRLPWEVNPLFQDWLSRHVPERAERIMARVRDMRGGRDYDARFGTRMRGEGVWSALLTQRFEKACLRYGLNRERTELDLTRFRPPSPAQAAGSATSPGRPATGTTPGRDDDRQGSLF